MSALADMNRFKGATYFTPSYRAIYAAILGFVEQLRSQPLDPLHVEFFDSGTLMKSGELMAGLQEGLVHFVFQTSTYISKSFPILEIFNLPGPASQLYEHGDRVAMSSPLWEHINTELARDNLFLLSAGGGTLEPQYLWSSKKRIASLNQLKGLRCRTMGREASFFLESSGAVPVSLPSSQTHLALQRGLVDAVVANVSTVIARNLLDQLRYCFKLPILGLSIGVFLRRDVWDGLRNTDRNSFWSAGLWYDANQAPVTNTRVYPLEYWPAVRASGIEVIDPSLQELKRFTVRVSPMINRWKREVGEDVGSRAIALAEGTS